MNKKEVKRQDLFESRYRGHNPHPTDRPPEYPRDYIYCLFLSRVLVLVHTYTHMHARSSRNRSRGGLSGCILIPPDVWECVHLSFRPLDTSRYTPCLPSYSRLPRLPLNLSRSVRLDLSLRLSLRRYGRGTPWGFSVVPPLSNGPSPGTPEGEPGFLLGISISLSERHDPLFPGTTYLT